MMHIAVQYCIIKVHGIVAVKRGHDTGTPMHAWMDVLVMVLHMLAVQSLLAMVHSS